MSKISFFDNLAQKARTPNKLGPDNKPYLDQIITPETPKLGPDNNFTTHIYIYINQTNTHPPISKSVPFTPPFPKANWPFARTRKEVANGDAIWWPSYRCMPQNRKDEDKTWHEEGGEPRGQDHVKHKCRLSLSLSHFFSTECIHVL